MSGRDPWEGTDVRPVSNGAEDPGLFSGPNLPYTIITILAFSALTAFVIMASPFATGPSAAGSTTTAAITTTTIDGAAATSTVAGDPGSTTTTVPAGGGSLPAISLELVASGLAQPVGAWSIPGDERVFVIERGGRIVVIDGSGAKATFLNLADRVNSGGIENGLLGLAFHPEYASNGRLFVYYTRAEADDDSPDTRVAEFTASSGTAASVDASTERVLLDVEQLGIRHRAGMLQFGPDGYLWIALGDGGLGDRSAQDLESLQGSILRIDVDSGDPYGIPTDNPYAGGGGLAEIWAHGLRNPWRFFIDETDGLIYIGDVGQADVEEINVAPVTEAAIDWGWPNFEGDDCYQPSDDCDMVGWQGPTVTFGHGEGACSVTGGIVYRGAAMPEVVGHYFYADWCIGFIRSFRYAGGAATEERDWSAGFAALGTLQISSFGWDGANEMLVVDSNGSVYRVVPVG